MCALAPTPLAPLAIWGGALVTTGVAHFATANAEYQKTGDWVSASNNAGLTFGMKVNIDDLFGSSKDKSNGVTQNNSVVPPKSDTSGGGKTKEDSSSGSDVVNGFFGTYFTALDNYATANASYVYKYGTQAVSATALTEANAARMLGIAKGAQTLGNTLGLVTGGYSLYNAEMNRRLTGEINYKGYADGIIGITGGVAGTIVTFSLVSNPVGWGVIATGAALYGIGSFAYDAYHYKN
jgi:hypothetical protein